MIILELGARSMEVPGLLETNSVEGVGTTRKPFHPILIDDPELLGTRYRPPWSQSLWLAVFDCVVEKLATARQEDRVFTKGVGFAAAAVRMMAKQWASSDFGQGRACLE